MRVIDPFEEITQNAIQTRNEDIIERTIEELAELYDYIDNKRMLDGSVQGETIKENTLNRIINCINILQQAK